MGAAFREISSPVDRFNLPPLQEFMDCSRNNSLQWNCIPNFKKHPDQCEESFDEQKLAIETSIASIDHYMDYTRQTHFVKCQVIAGSPGSGKSFLLNYIAIYAMSRGLKVLVTALMDQRAVHLGGIHLHKIFSLPVKKLHSLTQSSENALRRILQNPVSLHILKTVDIIFLDEIGQISSELMSSLDLILRQIRNNNIYLGGVLFICTLDHAQLQPIDGKPFLVSPMILSCYRFVRLNESVRASGDTNLQRIQRISRMNPRKLSQDNNLIIEFKNLLLGNCTFVNDWSDSIITPNTYRVYGKKLPARQASEKFIQEVSTQLSDNEYMESNAVDKQMPQQSHGEWNDANELTSNSLDQKCKEPRKLLFFVGAVYQFTYNEDGKFSQSQLCLLLELPSKFDIDNFRAIQVMVSPPGNNFLEYDPNMIMDDYIQDGWVLTSVGVAPERPQTTPLYMRGKRKQYGLKHHYTSTVHACMGDTLNKIVTEISPNSHQLWDKGQAVVLLSRTKLAEDIIFVGDKRDTVKALSLLIQIPNQWMNYMDNVMELASVNESADDLQVSVFHHQECPFRLCDMQLPTCNTGFVYMLVSLQDTTFSYIGETGNLITRLNQHNSGHGAASTIPSSLRPYAFFAYVSGFNYDKKSRRQFESMWQRRRDEERIRGMICMKQIAKLAYDIISYCHFELILTLNFDE